jgi:hypothetical protein
MSQLNELKVHETTALLIAHLLECHAYCATCKIHFLNTAHLKSHILGKHTDRSFICVGDRCYKKFKLISGLTSHLESGACKSGATRIVVNRVVVRLDAHNVITNPNRLITGPDGYEPPESTRLLATEISWNGSSYGCFLCPSTFTSLKGLNMHLESQKHDEAIYRCPNKEHCRKEFKALSILCSHIQNNKCGVMQLQYATEAMESLVAGLKELEI